MAYDFAIGCSYSPFGDNLGMPKTKERTFLERAMEALRERYPKEKPTQTRLAKIADVSQPAVHEWGLPDRAPSYPSVKKLAEELNVCVEWLYTERGPKRPAATAENPDDALSPILQIWPNLDVNTRKQIARYADFVKDDKPK
jgi:hypothetical protein